MSEFNEVPPPDEQYATITKKDKNWLQKSGAKYIEALSSTGIIGATIFQELAQRNYGGALALALPAAYTFYRQMRTKDQIHP